jgi:hypothetical protein
LAFKPPLEVPPVCRITDCLPFAITHVCIAASPYTCSPAQARPAQAPRSFADCFHILSHWPSAKTHVYCRAAASADAVS